MPSQIVTTFGSYATAPTQIVRLMLLLALRLKSMRSEQRYSQNGLADEVAQNIARRRHHCARMGIAEQSLDGKVLGKRGAAAHPHRRRRDGDRDLASSRLALEHA